MSEFRLQKVLFQHDRTTVSLGHFSGKYNGHRVVLKRTDLRGASLETRKLAIQEGQLLSRLRHPNIIKCLDHYEEGESIVVVMEWAELGDLGEAWVRPSSPKELAEKCMDITIQVLLALRHLHSLGTIHRDVKTRNILASRLVPGSSSLRVKLGDFGIARMTRSSAGMAKTTIGTPYYSSPEIFSGETYDVKSDIWSLGCVVYELVAGCRPFQSSEFRELSRKVRQGTYPPLSKDVPFGLRDIVDSMLQADPARRPSATELLGHPYVREQCNRLFELLQRRDTMKASSVDPCENEFLQKYRQLQSRLGTKGAAEAIIELMAPEMYGQLSRARTEEQILNMARLAWNKHHKIVEDTTRASEASDSVQELTMTIREMTIHHTPSSKQDPSTLRDRIMSHVESWEEFRLLHSLMKSKIEMQKIAVVLQPGRYRSLESSGALNLMRKLIEAEADYEALSID